MRYTLYSLLRKHGEVMSEKSSKNHSVGYIQNGNCQIIITKYTYIFSFKIYKDSGLKGVPPAPDNDDFLDCGLKGVPPAAKDMFFWIWA